MSRSLAIAAVLGSLMVAGPASAADVFAPVALQPIHGWYVEVLGNAFLPPDSKIDVNGPGLGTGTYNEEDGISASLIVGTGFAPQWRGEVELSYSHGEDGNVFLGGVKIPHSGDIDGYSASFNVLYDPDFTGYRLRPFVGAGIGLTLIDIDDLGAVGGAFVTNDDDVAFTANLIAGVDVPLTDRISLTGRYRMGIITGTNYDTTAPPIDVDAPTQFFHALSAGIKINLY